MLEFTQNQNCGISSPFFFVKSLLKLNPGIYSNAEKLKTESKRVYSNVSQKSLTKYKKNC